MSETNDEYQGKHEADHYVEEPVIGDAPPKADVLLSNKVYDWFKSSSLYVLPALAAAYFGIAQIWGLPYAEEVVGTVAVLETLLGVVLRVSNKQYEGSESRFDGSILVEPGEDEDTTNLNVLLDPDAIARKKEITVRIDKA